MLSEWMVEVLLVVGGRSARSGFSTGRLPKTSTGLKARSAGQTRRDISRVADVCVPKVLVRFRKT